ncbi:MAG TPA: B12-binding domain-containing radical SAM protein [Candidatus Tripitaka californicus]|uniref:B12-binding domain-containing radical SAM protein n=2 Tax=Candidatus Tripitaka californicus TaxID=3367616 RepID=UPI0040270085
MLLVNPQRNRRQQLGALAPYVPLNVPFGVGWLAGYLLHKGKHLVAVDEEITPVTDGVLDDYARKATPPYIFGVSCLTANVGRGYEIARRVKEKFPESTVVFGGIHPTVMAEEVLGTGLVDVVVRNEGEITLLELYEALKEGRDYHGLAGITYLDGEKIVHNSARPLLDMKELPIFPYFLFEKHSSRYDLGFLSSSRGCPYECIFCSQRAITGRLFRFLPTDKTIETLDVMINKNKQKSIVFSDDNFIVNRSRVIELCNAICENGFNKKAGFMCQIRGDAVNEEMLGYLKKANFTGLSFGIETASERLMVLLKKSERVEDNIHGIKMAKKHGFKATGTFILGLPTETREERWAAYELAKELDLDYVRFNIAVPYPGTELYEIAKREGRLNAGPEWKNLNACGTLLGVLKELPYVPTTCNERELMMDVFWSNIFYSLRPQRVLKMFFHNTAETAGWLSFKERWYLRRKEWENLLNLIFEGSAVVLRMAFYSVLYKLQYRGS